MRARERLLEFTEAIIDRLGTTPEKLRPDGHPETFCTDHWHCRLVTLGGKQTVTHGQIVAMLADIAAAGFDFVKMEHLHNFDDPPGYSPGQGQ